MRTLSKPMILGGVGLLGALAGHFVGYWAAHPEQGDRHAVLEASGHGYFDVAIALALVAGLMALLGQFVLGYRGADEPLGRWATGATLAAMQTLVFVSVEVAERALNAASLNIFSEPALWLGLPLQVGFAALGAMLLTAVRKVGSALAARSFAPASGAVPLVSLTAADGSPTSRWFGFSFLSRGPPARSFS
jgi:hypothetical protein